MSTKDWLEKDYYKILGVPKDADTDAVKKAYRKLARELHPDHNTNDKEAETKFKDVSEAYAVLSNPEKRKEYDDARSLFGGGFRAPTGSTGSGGGFNFDLGDLFTGTGGTGGLGDVLGGVFGQRSRPRTSARRGADVETEVRIGFTDAVDGKTVPLKMTSSSACTSCAGTGARAGTVPRVCPTCTGTGFTSTDSGGFGMAEPCKDCRGRGLVVDDPCPVCKGSGRGTSSRVIHVRIPAGVGDGQRIRLKGKGAPGESGGPGGDLYIRVHVTPHPVFGRKGANLTIEVPVTYPEAALGAEIKAPTLHGGPVTLKIPAGTPNGRTFRVRGRGIARKDGSKGDLLVTVNVDVPDELDDQTREALEKMRSTTSGESMRARLLDDVGKGG